MKAQVIKVFSENADFQVIETLRRKRAKRSRLRTFFVEGVRAINQAAAHGWQFNAFVFTRQQDLSSWALTILEEVPAETHYELTAPLMAKLSQKEVTSELIALLAMPADDLARIVPRPDLLVAVLDRPASPGNLGSIIRSCDALGAHGIIITGHATDLYDPETIRATTGSFFSLPVVQLPSHNELLTWIGALKAQLPALRLAGTSAKATLPIDHYDSTIPLLLLIGNETHGLSQGYKDLCDDLLTIPMQGSASSLNIASATSILLYEIARQRRNAA